MLRSRPAWWPENAVMAAVIFDRDCGSELPSDFKENGFVISRFPLLLAALLALAGGSAQAQQSGGTAVRVAGTIESLTNNQLVVDAKDGQKQAVRLAPDTQVYGLEQRQLSDNKACAFVASVGVRGTDGKIHAVEVRIFPEALRGIGEGQRPWDVKPEGVMTNATVGTVSQAGAGGVIHVTYKDGQSEFTVDPDVPILAYVAADRVLLKP